MFTSKQPDPRQYLNSKMLSYKEYNGELQFQCPFSQDCHSQHHAGHCYMNIGSGLFQCKKCGKEGNLKQFAEHFGDDLGDGPIKIKKSKKHQEDPIGEKIIITDEDIEKYHQALPKEIKNWLLNERGLSEKIINQRQLGYGKFYGRYWITIPIKLGEGEWFLKLKKDPQDDKNSIKNMVYPKGSSVSLYGVESLTKETDYVVICEGELDMLVLETQSLIAVTSTGGAGTFKKEWVEKLRDLKEIYLAFDRDEAGQKGAEKLIQILSEELPQTRIYRINFPNRMKEGKDVTDYFVTNKGGVDEFMYKLAEQVAGLEKIDSSSFEEMSLQELATILGLTVKNDEENKLATFNCLLSAYTEESQFNISFNAPSSSGKSYIPIEIAQLFPVQDVLKLAHCSPTAFFHDIGVYNKEKQQIEVDLSKKILIFLDEPHNQLLERLRPLFSHDDRYLIMKITDKSQRAGLKTKTVRVKGFPAVVFCSAGLKIDEQEGTRFLLLSPSISQEKLKAGVRERIRKETDREEYQAWIEADPKRQLLKKRILAIRNEQIKDIKIPQKELIEELFLKGKNILKPRHQRDVWRFITFVKMRTLLNLWFRKGEGDIIFSTEEDIQEAYQLWEKIAESQEYNLPPYIYELHQKIIVPLWEEKQTTDLEENDRPGLSRKELQMKHLGIYGRPLIDWQLRQQILPMLEAAGLIIQENDPNDHRQKLIYPPVQLTILKNDQQYSE